MASPAEIANDMAARVHFWRGRDKDIADTCLRAASVIRDYLAGEHVDGRRVTGVIIRLDKLAQLPSTRDITGIAPSAGRAATCLRDFRSGLRT